MRYLKAAQVSGQLRHRLRPCWERPEQFFQMPVPEPSECGWDRLTTFLAPGVQGNRAVAVEAGCFRFLNREEALGWPPADWDVPDLPKLWQYNLHYFDWLWSLDFPAGARLFWIG